MLRLEACAGCAKAGAKAAVLGQLKRAKMNVLDGMLLEPEEPITAEALTEIACVLGGGPYAVRSSSPMEEGAAGVFESVIGVVSIDLADAIVRVRNSSFEAPARAYLAAKQIAPTLIPVLVQPLATAARMGLARSQGPNFLIEERDFGEPEWGAVDSRLLSRDDASGLAQGLGRIEALLGGPVDVEFAREGDSVIFLQALRTIEPPASMSDFDAEAAALTGRWTLDVAHNPAPLSYAQSELVRLTETLSIGPSQRVIGGYLYYQARESHDRPIPFGDLRARFEFDVSVDCERVIAEAERDGSLAAALSAFLHVYRRYVGEVSPSLRAARHALDERLRQFFGEGLSRHGALLGGLAGLSVERDQALWELGRNERTLSDYLAQFGAYSSVWDVTIAPDREAPERVLEDARALPPPSPAERQRSAKVIAQQAERDLLARAPDRAALKTLLDQVREALPVAEADDRLFFGAQYLVRRALLARGHSLAAAGKIDRAEDVFWLPLDLPATDLRAASAEKRARFARAQACIAPREIVDGAPRHEIPRARHVLRGQSTFGAAKGKAFKWQPGRSAAADSILVVPAILPSHGPLLATVRALVTDVGGVTSHGATLAREYGVAAVLGTRYATLEIEDGAELYVDGKAGKVYLL